jgi:hypothetical protein
MLQMFPKPNVNYRSVPSILIAILKKNQATSVSVAQISNHCNQSRKRILELLAKAQKNNLIELCSKERYCVKKQFQTIQKSSKEIKGQWFGQKECGVWMRVPTNYSTFFTLQWIKNQTDSPILFFPKTTDVRQYVIDFLEMNESNVFGKCQLIDPFPKCKKSYLIAFHGTTYENGKNILRHGFDPQYRRRFLYGKGDYFGRTVSYAEQYGSFVVITMLKRYENVSPMIYLCSNAKDAIPLGFIF